MDAVKLVRLACCQANRFPSERLGAGPKCGKCGAPLLDGTVQPIEPAILDKALRIDSVPLVVDFWAAWCGPCRMMAPELARAAVALRSSVRFAKLDTEAFPDMSRRFEIRGIPLLILFKDGREAARQAGAQPAAGVMRWTMETIGAKA